MSRTLKIFHGKIFFFNFNEIMSCEFEMVINKRSAILHDAGNNLIPAISIYLYSVKLCGKFRRIIIISLAAFCAKICRKIENCDAFDARG